MLTLSTPPGNKAAYHHGALRKALVEAALAILSEGGDPVSFSLREAARRAGVSAMAPYRHFPDKEALLAAVATVGFERLAEAQERADRHHDRLEAVIGQGVAYVGFACAEPALFRLMFGAGAMAKTGDLGTAAQRSYRLLADAVVTVAPPELAELETLRCWSLAHGLAALAVDGQLGMFAGPAAALAEGVLRLQFTPPMAAQSKAVTRDK